MLQRLTEKLGKYYWTYHTKAHPHDPLVVLYHHVDWLSRQVDDAADAQDEARLLELKGRLLQCQKDLERRLLSTTARRRLLAEILILLFAIAAAIAALVFLMFRQFINS